MATAEYRLSSKPTLMLRTRPARTPTRSPSRGSSTWSLVLLRQVSARLSRCGARAGTGRGLRAGQRCGLGDVRPVGLRREDDALDEWLAADQQAAQQTDLTRDQLGCPKGRRVEAEDRLPRRRLCPDGEA